MNSNELARGDDELARGDEALVVEATGNTPRLSPEQVAALAAAKRRESLDAMYRRSPGLYEAVTPRPGG